MAERAFGETAWSTRRGTAFAVTAADAAAFAQDHRTRLRVRRERGRGAWSRAFDSAIGLAVIAFVAAFVTVAISLSRGFYAEPASNVLAGAILGAGAAAVALIVLAIRAGRRGAADSEWVLTTIRVGVDAETLWIFKHATLSVFTSPDAFVDVVRTDRLMLAYVNRTSAHAFPLAPLAESPEGREVLAWFEAHWPSSRDAMPAFPTWRQELRRAARRGRNGMIVFAALGLLYAVFQYLTEATISPQNVRGQAESPPRPAQFQEPERQTSPALTGGRATDFINGLARPMGR